MDKNITYNEAMMRLEEIMSHIQGGNVDIDKLTEELAEAQQLIDFCRSRIFKVDKDVKKMLDALSDTL